MNALVDNVNTLADRDKLINHLQDQINSHMNFLGGGVKLSNEEKEKLKTLESYLKEYGSGKDKRDLDAVSSLLAY